MARQLALTNKKVRGIPRRIRAIKRWSESFEHYFPENIPENEAYYNIKIPVLASFVQGKQTTQYIQSTCAQQLINAAYRLFQAKPQSQRESRVTCCIVLPDMFVSELCIFTVEDYFNLHTQNGESYLGKIEQIHNKSLAQLWELDLPSDFYELGVIRKDIDEEGQVYFSEHWYFGEVQKRG